MNYYCMYQKIGSKKIIFGVGSTEEEAKADAQKYAENMDSLIMGQCTEEVYNQVLKHGGDGDYEVY